MCSDFAFQSSVHNNFAIVLCNEVLLDTDPYNIQVLVRALTQLELILDDEIVLQNISTVAEKVAEVRILCTILMSGEESLMNIFSLVFLK